MTTQPNSLTAPIFLSAHARSVEPEEATSESTAVEHFESIGQRLRNVRPLTDQQIEQILLHQRQNGLRFGDSAVALKLATEDEVRRALSQQFDFPYATQTQCNLSSDLVTAIDPFGDQADVFRDLRTRLLLEHMDPPHPHHALAVVSTSPGDGKSYCAANLAISLSQLGRRTLLVDANLRKPTLHKMFGMDSQGGLGGVLAGHHSATDAIQAVPDLPSLAVLLAGGEPPNPQELVQRPTFTLLMAELLTRFDHVIVDTPAASLGADARLLAAKCGSALIVGRRQHSKVSELQALGSALTRTATHVAGIVMNAR